MTGISTTSWRTYHGAEYRDVREIPCLVIAAGYLTDQAGDPIYEEHPEISQEIERRGRAIYRDHAYGDGHQIQGWGAIPVIGCDHSEKA